MRNNLPFALALALALALSATAPGCGDTDEEETPQGAMANNNGAENNANNANNGGTNNGTTDNNASNADPNNNNANNANNNNGGTNNPNNNPNTNNPNNNNGGTNNLNNTNNTTNNTNNTPCEGPTCDGAPWPEWELVDFHPASDRFEEVYGPSSFDEAVTVVALLAGWCPFCQSQAIYLERMRLEYEAAGVPVNFIAINGTSADNDMDRENLIYIRDDNGDILLDDDGDPVYRCQFPLFQATEAVDGWALHGGAKDDIAIYREDGTLFRFYERGETEVDTNLAMEEGYMFMVGEINAALME